MWHQMIDALRTVVQFSWDHPLLPIVAGGVGLALIGAGYLLRQPRR
jgi:hypothetical protein